MINQHTDRGLFLSRPYANQSVSGKLDNIASSGLDAIDKFSKELDSLNNQESEAPWVVRKEFKLRLTFEEWDYTQPKPQAPAFKKWLKIKMSRLSSNDKNMLF